MAYHRDPMPHEPAKLDVARTWPRLAGLGTVSAILALLALFPEQTLAALRPFWWVVVRVLRELLF